MKRIERCVPSFLRGLLRLAPAMILALSFANACKREEPAAERTSAAPSIRYGEPIGIKVSGAGIPPLLAAVAVTEHRSAESAVSALASQLHAAVSRCPGAIARLNEKKAIVLRLATSGDIMSIPLRDTDETAMCVADALVGGSLPSTGDLRLMVELRLDPSTP